MFIASNNQKISFKAYNQLKTKIFLGLDLSFHVSLRGETPKINFFYKNKLIDIEISFFYRRNRSQPRLHLYTMRIEQVSLSPLKS
jgi:hypothetical protein